MRMRITKLANVLAIGVVVASIAGPVQATAVRLETPIEMGRVSFDISQTNDTSLSTLV